MTECTRAHLYCTHYVQYKCADKDDVIIEDDQLIRSTQSCDHTRGETITCQIRARTTVNMWSPWSSAESSIQCTGESFVQHSSVLTSEVFSMQHPVNRLLLESFRVLSSSWRESG